MDNDKKQGVVLLLVKFVFVMLIFSLGYVTNGLVNSYVYQKNLEGFYLRESSFQEVKNFQDLRDPEGDWVCVNIRGMSYERAIEVINHEVGHEIFAENCEENITKCLEAVR